MLRRRALYDDDDETNGGDNNENTGRRIKYQDFTTIGMCLFRLY
jgi:hypothetical protein